MPFKESEGFPQAFDRFEKYAKSNNLSIQTNNDLLFHFLTWGSMTGVNYTPMTKEQVRHVRYEAKIRNWAYADKTPNVSGIGKSDYQYRDRFTGRFVSKQNFEMQSKLK